MKTKQARDEARAYQFAALLNNGYAQETFKGVDIFANVNELLLKVYIGTSAKPAMFYKYRSLEQMNARIQAVKESATMREDWKAKQKAENNGKSSSHAAAAQAIRDELKKAFKDCKFSVTSDSFSGGNAVRISWTDGVTAGEVENIVNKYQYGHFDGMNDIYENTNSRDDIPQVKYVTASRTISDEALTKIKNAICELMDFSSADQYRDQPEQIAYRIAAQSVLNGDFKVVRNTNDSGVGYESFFTVVSEQATQPEPLEGQIQVITYSEKSFAVIGERTKAMKEDLYNLGGKYNKFLKCGKGWIFSNKNLNAVVEYLKTQTQNV